MRTVVNAYLEGWHRYADFSGLTAAVPFIGFFAVNFSVGVVLAMLQDLAGGFFALLTVVYALAALLPGVAITVRFARYLLAKR